MINRVMEFLGKTDEVASLRAPNNVFIEDLNRIIDQAGRISRRNVFDIII